MERACEQVSEQDRALARLDVVVGHERRRRALEAHVDPAPGQRPQPVQHLLRTVVYTVETPCAFLHGDEQV